MHVRMASDTYLGVASASWSAALQHVKAWTSSKESFCIQRVSVNNVVEAFQQEYNGVSEARSLR